MKVFVTGVAGQLGHDVMNELPRRGHEGIGSDRAATYTNVGDSTDLKMSYYPLDITNNADVERVLDEVKPDVVIHCAAWTAVDLAEDEDNIPIVHAVNAVGTEYLALACKHLGCKMMYISTDYVFNGQGEAPWDPDNKDYQPLNIYGQTKLEGELAVARHLSAFYIVRIAWVFGLHGNNFVKTILRLGKTHETLRVVNDQIGTPTYTLDLARLLVDMIETDHYGYYHVTNEGDYISWYDFACEVFKITGYNTRVIPVTTQEYGLSKAKRPNNSRLNREKVALNGFKPLPEWKDALARYLKDIGQ